MMAKTSRAVTALIAVACGTALVALTALPAAATVSAAQNPANLLTQADSYVKYWTNTNIKLPGPSTPVSVGKHKVMIIEAVNAGGASQIAAQATAAFQQMGWDSTVFDGKFSPAEQAKGIQLAISQGYDGILGDAIDTNTLTAPIKAALDKGLKMACVQCGETPGFPQIANVTVTGLQDGNAYSWYIIQQTKGKANVLMVVDRGFDIVLKRRDSLKANLLKRCPQCTFKTVEMSTSQIAQPGPPVLQAALRTDKTINWVAPPYSAEAPTVATTVSKLAPAAGVNAWDGLPDTAAIIAGGKSPLKVEGGAPLYYMSWGGADQLARLFAGQPLWPSTDMPFRLFPRATVGQIKTGNWTPPGFDYQKFYEGLWQK